MSCGWRRALPSRTLPSGRCRALRSKQQRTNDWGLALLVGGWSSSGGGDPDGAVIVPVPTGEAGSVATRDVFSEEELARLRGFPEIGRAELIRYFTLAAADEAFVGRFRGGATCSARCSCGAAVAGVRAR